MEIPSKNLNWIKYVVGGIIFAVGIGLLFIGDKTTTIGYIMAGLGIGLVISH